MATSKTLEGPYEFYPERLTSKEMELEDVYAFSYGDNIYLGYNPLNDISLSTYIPQLEARGANVNLVRN